MNKSDLRKKYKAKRAALTVSQVEALDRQLLDHLKGLPWEAIQYLHCFLPIEKFKEYNTLPFLQWIGENYPKITVVISKSDFQSHELTHYKYNAETLLKLNPWGIPEPEFGEEISVSLIDAIITPLLVVDQLGNRVGYGKGFYDRFFSACRPDVLKIGVSYFDPIKEISDLSDWDIPLSLVVSPAGVFSFENPQ